MNLVKKILIAGSLMLAVCGCKKNNPTPDDYLAYKVDGVYKTLKPEADILNGDLLVEAGKIGAEDLWIFVNVYPAPGTYNLANIDTASISYSLGADSYDSIISHTGKLIISAYNGKRISGSFYFTGSNGQNTKTISQGKFETKIIQLGNVAPCSFDSTCYVGTAHGTIPPGELLEHLKLIKAERLTGNK